MAASWAKDGREGRPKGSSAEGMDRRSVSSVSDRCGLGAADELLQKALEGRRQRFGADHCDVGALSCGERSKRGGSHVRAQQPQPPHFPCVT